MDVAILTIGIALAITLLSLIILIRLAPLLGLMDQPGGRKQHAIRTPVVGGLAIALGLLPVLAVFPAQPVPVLAWFLGSVFIVLLGLADDLWDISALQKFVGQCLSGIFILIAGLGLTNLGHLLGSFILQLGWLAVPVTLFAVVAAINGMNMMDGIDGLLGLVGAVPLIFILWLSHDAGLIFEFALSGCLLLGLLVFLLFNFRFPWVRQASVFLGDAGSMLVGFNLAWLVISLSVKNVVPPVLALYLLALPLFDLAGVILRRRLLGISPATPGRDHLHHILLDAGFSVSMCALILAAVAMLFACGGMLCWFLGLHEAVLFVVFVVLLVGYVLLSRSVQRMVSSLRDLMSLVRQDMSI